MSKARSISKLTPATSGVVSIAGTAALKVPVGTTAERPSGEVGLVRYNSTTGATETYTSLGWVSLGRLSVSSVVPTTYNGESGSNFTIYGEGFVTGTTVKFITNANVEYTAGTVTILNSTTLQATTPQDFTVAQEPLSIKVIDSNGNNVILSNVIDCGSSPTWVTSPGSIGSVYEALAANLSVSATESDGGTIAYSVSSGTLPSGLTINSNTGAITGSPALVSSDTTYNFTLQALDNAGNINTRNFSITVLDYPTTYDSGDEIGGLSVAYTGAVATGAINNNVINGWDSWNTDTGTNNTTAGNLTGISSQFARSVTLYKSTSFECGGIELWSGHGNATDPLPAKDVAFYYSTDTTDGSNGTWTILTPKQMNVSLASKSAGAINYIGQRTSAIDSNHVVLSGNYVTSGGAQTGGTIANSYALSTGNISDKIFWDTVTCKGLRIDIRTRWSNGYYGNEKPHITEVNLYQSNHYGYIGTELEQDVNTRCYIDMASGRSYNNTTLLTDLSGKGYNFDTSSGVPSGSASYSATNGGVLNLNTASIRNANAVRSTATSGFSMGCWIKFDGNGSTAGRGVIWTGNISSIQYRFFIRTAFGDGVAYHPMIGVCSGTTDIWTFTSWNNQQKISGYITTLSNYATKYHLLVYRYSSQGTVDISLNGEAFQTVYNNQNGFALATGSNMAFGVGGDPYNDNYSSHSYGGWWWYDGLVPISRVKKEWDRYKTRFGH